MSGTGSLPDDPGSRLEKLLEEQGLASPDPDPGPDPGPSGGDDPLEAALAGSRDAGEHEPGPAPAGEGEGGGEADGDGAVPADRRQGGAEPEDRLPDAPLFALLRTVQEEVGIDRIDRIWVFPPRRLEAGETSVVVVAAYPELDDHRRRVYAAHYTARADVPEPRLVLAEYGTAPTDRVGRLVEDVVERLKDQPAAPPHAFRVEGADDRWHATLHELAERYLEEAAKDPRLRR